MISNNLPSFSTVLGLTTTHELIDCSVLFGFRWSMGCHSIRYTGRSVKNTLTRRLFTYNPQHIPVPVSPSLVHPLPEPKIQRRVRGLELGLAGLPQRLP